MNAAIITSNMLMESCGASGARTSRFLWDTGAIRLWCLRATAASSIDKTADSTLHLLQQIASQAAQQLPNSPVPGMTARIQQLLGKVRQRAQRTLLHSRDCPADMPDLAVLMLPEQNLTEPDAAHGISNLQLQSAAYSRFVRACGSLGVQCVLATSQPEAWQQLHAISKQTLLPPVLLNVTDHLQAQVDVLLKVHGALSLPHLTQEAKL